MSKELLSKLGVGVFALIWFSAGLYYILSQPKSNVVVYDCSIAEISPDYPPQVKEECRKHRSGRI